MKILFIDQEILFAEALECLLESSFGLIIEPHYAKSIPLAIDSLVEYGKQDLIFLDVNLFENNGKHLVEKLDEMSTYAPVIVISEIENMLFGQLAIKAGASGFLSKTTDSKTLLEAIETVINGGIYNIFNKQKPELDRLINKLKITERQYEILYLLSQGLLNKQIAGVLNISSNTVNAHLHEIFAKLHVSNRTAAVQNAHRIGLI